MSVTLVSPPAPATAATAESAPGKANGDELAPGLDFASLLTGQLAPVIADALPKIALPEDTPESDPAAGDAANFLAALGLVAPEPVRTVETAPAAAGADSVLPGALTVDKALPDALPTLKVNTAAQSANPDGKAEAAAQASLNLAAAVDDKPAKFAVAAPLASTVDTAAAKSAPPDSALNSQPLPSINAGNSAANREVALSVPTPVRDQRWATDFGQKIVWLATNDKQVAQITLNPPQMGPIEISLSVDKGHATASFVSANAEVRDAIDTAMPRLREMFASAGINLGQTNVSAESFQQQAASGDDHRQTSHRAADDAILVGDSIASGRAGSLGVRQGSGMVDIFA